MFIKFLKFESLYSLKVGKVHNVVEKLTFYFINFPLYKLYDSIGPFLICFSIILISARSKAENKTKNKKKVIFTELVEICEIAACNGNTS